MQEYEPGSFVPEVDSTPVLADRLAAWVACLRTRVDSTAPLAVVA